MGKIIAVKDLPTILTHIKKTEKSIVLAGGCFDIIYFGHIKFIQKSKKIGDVLILLLESDERVKLLKGVNRPYFQQKERAQVLAAINNVDYIVLLPPIQEDKNYEKLVKIIRPDIISVTGNDRNLKMKENQARLVKAKIREIPYVKTLSSSNIARLLGID